MTLPPLPELRTAAQAAHIALTCISTHPTLDMSDYLRGRVDAAAAGLEAALAAVPAQPLTDEQIHESLCEACSDGSGPVSLAEFRQDEAFADMVAFTRALERRIAAAPQAVPVPAGWVLVPVEPTEDMLFSAEMSKVRGYRDLYNAMLAAAPKEQPHE